MPPSFPRRSGQNEAIEARAAAWLAQRDEGFTPQEAEEFDQWQRADPRHAAAVARLEAAWKSLQQLRDFRPDAAFHPDRDLLLRRRRRVVRFPTLVVVAGAAAAAVALAVLGWGPRPKSPAAELSMENRPVYRTTTDGYQRVTLVDGSVLELNAASAVRIEFEPAERHVTLLEGEAHFTVSKNKARPFTVDARHVRVRAVGTAFDVRLDDNRVAVLVTEGKVTVGSNAPPAASHASPASLLKAGQRILVAMADSAQPVAEGIEVVSADLMRDALAWQGPRLRFVETPLAEVLAQFNARNQVQLELGDPALGTWPVDGSFRAENVEAFVRLLESSGGIRAEHAGANRIILRRE